MSKPDPADGSLESILASIRKSLAEQSSEATSEQPDSSSAAEAEAKANRRHGLAERLAGTAPSGGKAPQVADDLSDLLESSGDSLFPAAPASSAPPAQAASPAPEDPLWFLSRRDEPKAAPNQSPPGSGRDEGATPRPGTPAAEPSLTRPEVLRASMPPFFGSSSDSTVVTPPAEASPAASAPQARPASSPSPSPAPAATTPQEPPIAREVSLVAAAAENAAARSAPSSAPSLNGAVPAIGAAVPGDAASNRALEAVVLDLLKPMLRQWLDENMPRLVAQSLSEEAVRGRGLDGSKKS